jgi:hypothetical protein
VDGGGSSGFEHERNDYAELNRTLDRVRLPPSRVASEFRFGRSFALPKTGIEMASKFGGNLPLSLMKMSHEC